MNFSRITGIGGYLPENKCTNQDLELSLDTTDEWITTRTGIKSRSIALSDQTTSDLAFLAAQEAINDAGISPDDLDMIIVATCTSDCIFPSVASFVQKKLNISRTIPAFDLSAACSGFIYSLDVAKQYISSGAANHILVVGAERMSKVVDWQDRSTCILFGDGAGAVVLSKSDVPGILATELHSLHDEHFYLYLGNLEQDKPSEKVHMSGSEVFKIAVSKMSDVVIEVLKKAGLEKTDIDWLVPHQANIRIINAIAKKLDLPPEKVIITLADQGNTSSASVPLALAIAKREGKIKRGDILLLEAFGGGLTWGAMIVQY